MPTEKTRITITLDDDLASKIDDYRFANRQKNQTQAIVSLIKKGFASMPDDSEKTEKTSMLEGTEDFISLEESNRLFDMLVDAGLIEDNAEFAPGDRAFLTHVIGLLEVWIKNKRT